MRRIYGYIIGVALLGGMATGVQAAPEAKRQIGYDDIAGGKLAARSVYGLRAMEDGEHYTTLSRNGDVLRWRYADGALVDTLFRRPEGFPQVSIYKLWELPNSSESLSELKRILPVRFSKCLSTPVIY